MSTATPTLQHVIEEALDSALMDVHTALPGKLQSYDIVTKTGEVELQVENPIPKLDETFITEKFPVLQNVPVLQSQTNNFFVSLPIEPGAYGLVHFCELSIDQWQTLGAVSDPGDVGRCTLTGGVFVPGLVPLLERLTTELALDTELAIGKKQGTQIRLNTEVEIKNVLDVITPVDPAANAVKIDLLWSLLYTVLSSWPVAANDGGQALQDAFNNAFPAPPLSVALTKLKAQ